VDGTRLWLGDAERQMETLKSDLGGLDRMRTTLDELRQEVDQLTAAMSVVEARRGVVDEVQRRLVDVSQLGASIEERARGLSERLVAAEDHLGALAPRLDDLSRAGNQVLALGAELREMEQRLRSVQGNVGGLEERAKTVATLADRMQDLAREVEQRQNALARATEHLDRAGILRQEAAEAAETLATRAREIDAVLERADGRLEACDALSRGLESRIASLTAVQDRIGTFEAKLAEWRVAEQQLTQAMEQASMRQASIAALQGEIRALYEVAERTQADARAVAEAQPQVARTRAELDALLDRLGDAGSVLRTLEERRRQLDRTEERLAHADTLMTDVRGALARDQARGRAARYPPGGAPDHRPHPGHPGRSPSPGRGDRARKRGQRLSSTPSDPGVPSTRFDADNLRIFSCVPLICAPRRRASRLVTGEYRPLRR
jgi:chromosome segregation ATPase